jgi:signal transduction histidine kinase
VRLELFTDERLVTVAVSDQGIGIKPEELVTIFEPFQRSTTVRGTIPGLGLGLPISKKIIEAHGGDIRIKSKVGEGSRFEFWLPKHPDGIRPS